jgi:hypothetical protein
LKIFQTDVGHHSCNSKPHSSDEAGAKTVKTTRITVETEQILIINRAKRVVIWCPLCSREGEFIFLDSAAFAEPTLAVQIEKWQTAGGLHLWKQENGLIRICLASLLCCFELDVNSGIQIAKEVL